MKNPFQFKSDEIVRRLCWVMVGAILFSMLNTLAGQPESFWHSPDTAIRGDGLSIHHETNHTFEFFLGRGWPVYLLVCAFYMATAIFIVSALPRTAALIAIFTFLFGHYFGACNWLVVRWHLGFNGVALYGAGLATAVGLSAFTGADTSIARRLRWIAVFTVFMDCVITLIGQPHSYWQHPETVHEGNPLSYFILSRGYIYFCLYDLGYMAVVFLLVSYLPGTIALITGFAFAFAHFTGVSNWFFYQWRMGMKVPVLYGAILGTMIVILTLRNVRQQSRVLHATPEPAITS